jgi:hypothetical protein
VIVPVWHGLPLTNQHENGSGWLNPTRMDLCMRRFNAAQIGNRCCEDQQLGTERTHSHRQIRAFADEGQRPDRGMTVC